MLNLIAIYTVNDTNILICYLFNSITSKKSGITFKKATKMASLGASILVGNVSSGANSGKLLTGTSRAAACHYMRS